MTDKKAILWLSETTAGKKFYIVLLILLRALSNGGAVCYALAMKKTVDSAVSGSTEGFFCGLFIFGGLILATMLINMLTRHIDTAAKSGIENCLRKKLLGTLLGKNYGQVSSVHSEEWMSRLTSDTSVCAGGITEILPGLAGMLVRMIGALIMIFALQPMLAYILIPCGIIFVPITLVLRKYLKKHHKAVQEKEGKVRVFLQENISSMLILHTFGKEEQTLDNAQKELADYKKVQMKKSVVSNICNTGFAFAINGMYLAGFFICGYGILNGTVTYGTLTAVLQLVGQLQAPLSGITGFVPRYYAMIASAERLMEAEEFIDIETDRYKTSEEIRELYTGRVESFIFDKVSFCYRKGAVPALENLSLDIHKGDFIAFTGQSGCGKSTLLKLLMGIYEPTSGTVELMLDGGESLPITKAKRLFAYVPQGNCLMCGTIREVITFGEKETDGEKLKKAIKLACSEFIYGLSDGLDTVLGEKGLGLSEGQMQRISIARALYADSPVLILDEATSALDEETEKQLLNNLKKLTDKTVFIVTHRPEALNICNRQFDFSENTVL